MTRLQKAQGTDQAFVDIFPVPVTATRAPTSGDTRFPLGQIWVRTDTAQAWTLCQLSSGAATWAIASPGASDVDTVNSLSPAAGNIIIDGGTNMTDSNAGSTVTMNMDAAITLATSVSSPIFTSTGAIDTNINAVASQDIIVKMGDAGGVNKVSFVDSASAEVATIDSNGAFTTTGLTFSGLLTANASATILTAGTALNLGSDNDAGAVNLGIGTTARTITIGGSGAATVIALGNGYTGGSISMGAAMTSGTITIGGTGAHVGAFAIAPSTGGQTVSLANLDGAKVINIGAGVDGNTISLGNGINTSAQIVNIANGASGANTTLNIMSGIGTVGAGIIAFGNNTRVTTIGIGDIAPAAARAVTICGGDSAQNDIFNVLSDNPSAGAQTINMLAGVPSGGTQVMNLLTQTGQAGTINIATGAAMANTITVGGTGANVITLGNTQTAGSIAMGDAMIGGTITIGGSAGQTGTITISASTAAQIIAIANLGGAKTIGIGDGVDGNQITVGNGVNTTAQAVSIAGGASAANSTVNILSGNVAAGTSTLNLGTGTGGKTINIANGAGLNAVILGSTNTSSSLILQSGTGRTTMTGTVKEIDAEFLSSSGDDYTFQASPMCLLSGNAPALPAGATGEVDLLTFPGLTMESFVVGAGQTIIAPVMDATGLLVSGDLTATEGFEYNWGGALATSRHAFTIGTSAAFFLEWKFTAADVSGGAPYMCGFRKTEANNATLTSYTDYAMIGIDAVANLDLITIKTELNSVGTTNTNTTDAWTNGQSHTMTILVSAAGVVTYLIDGVAPSATAAYTFDNADVVVPFFRLEHQAGAPGAVHWETMKCGFQA